ncbi:MAG: hypothetical protein RIF32_12490, partial [Leptospirales bacterium]
MQVDKWLTEQLNRQAEVQHFMGMVAESLHQELTTNASVKNHVKFYLKGGTALRVLDPLRTANSSWSDWDTNLLIDPDLPMREWYAVLREIDAILRQKFFYFQAVWDGMYPALHSKITGAGSNGPALYIDSASADGLRKIFPGGGNFQIHLAEQTARFNAYASFPFHPENLHENYTTLSAGRTAAARDAEFEHFFHSAHVADNPQFIFEDSLRAAGGQAMAPARIAQLRTNGTLIFLGQVHLQNANHNLYLINVEDGSQRYLKEADLQCLLDSRFEDAAQCSSVVKKAVASIFYLYRILVRYHVEGVNTRGLAPGPNVIGQQPGTDFRAELLDVGIPRRDAADSPVNWGYGLTPSPPAFLVAAPPAPLVQHNKRRIPLANQGPFKAGGYQIPVPTHAYFAQDYIKMLASVLEGEVLRADKTIKRLQRGIQAFKDAWAALGGSLNADANNLKLPNRPNHAFNDIID